MVPDSPDRAITRRRAIQATGGALLTGLAGCNAALNPLSPRTYNEDAPVDAVEIEGPWPTLAGDRGRSSGADVRGPGPDADPRRIATSGPISYVEPAIGPDHVLFQETRLEPSVDPNPKSVPRFVAVDPAGGERAWTVETAQQGATPTVAGRVAFCTTWDETLALDTRDGSVYWRYGAGWGGDDGSPVFVDGRLFVPDRHQVLALDPVTGQRRWKTRRLFDGAPVGLAAAGSRSGPLLVTMGGGKDDHLKAIDRESGEVVWNAPISGSSMAVTDDERVYALANDALHAVSLTNGSITWRRADVESGVMLRPAVADGTVYVGEEQSGSEEDLLALDAATGETRWRSRIGDYGTVQPPVVGTERVYVLTSTGRKRAVVAFDAETGTRRFRLELPFLASDAMALGEGSLYLLGNPSDDVDHGWLYELA